MYELVDSNVSMLGIELDEPFQVSFGTFSVLPVVILQLQIKNERLIQTGVGETSIVFPFINYDAFDIYTALNGVQRAAGSREDLLRANLSLHEQAPAAYAAYNMAIDDACGKHEGKNVVDLYEHSSNRILPKTLQSTGIDEPEQVKMAASKIDGDGFMPKIKLGKDVNHDIETVVAMKDEAYNYAIDFNAKYTLDELRAIFSSLGESALRNISFIEQPTIADLGIGGLVYFKKEILVKDSQIDVIADESFLTFDDALECAKCDVGLNYKIHRLGGLFVAKDIEKKLHTAGLNCKSMLGGTFPTAIGRVYDQQAALCLDDCVLPSDGLSPSTLWFNGDKHIIRNEFLSTENNKALPLQGAGLGIDVDWQKIKQFEIADPIQVYSSIRSDKADASLGIILNKGKKYSKEYSQLTGRAADWNL
jgi:L-alanine-DL-glutamate epimerase-like enolase superfamily enzyme